MKYTSTTLIKTHIDTYTHVRMHTHTTFTEITILEWQMRQVSNRGDNESG